MDTLILVGVLVSVALITSTVLYHTIYALLKNHAKREEVSAMLTITGIVIALGITFFILMQKPEAGGFEDTTIAWYTMAIYPLIYLLSILALVLNRNMKHRKPIGFLLLDNIIAGLAFVLSLSFTLVNIILFITINEVNFSFYVLVIYISTLPVLFLMLYALLKHITQNVTVLIISVFTILIAMPFVVMVVDNFLLSGAIQAVLESEISILIHFVTTVLSLIILLMHVNKEPSMHRTITMILALVSLVIPFVYGILI